MKGKRSGLLRGGKLALGVCVVWIASACVESLADEPRPNIAMLPPDVVALLTEADRAFFEGDDSTAQAAFARVLSKEPSYTPALWGRAVALLRLGRDYQAWPLIDTALGESPDPHALLVVARLAATAARDQPTAERQATARRYLDRVPQLSTRADSSVEDIEAEMWLDRLNGRQDAGIQLWQSLVSRRPEQYALVARPLRPVGSGASSADFKKDLSTNESISWGNWEPIRTAMAACLGVGLVWTAGLAVLFLLGEFFSRLTLRLMDRDGRGKPIPVRHELTRRGYRWVIQAAALYYYVSIIVFVVLLTVVPGSLVYALATSPRVPGPAVLAAVPLGAILVCLGVPIVRSFRARVVERAIGRLLQESDAPKLWELVREVANVVGTRPVDEIRLVTGALVSVSERGRPRDKRNGKSIRCLNLGMAAFDDFSLESFRAVIAHEYAHLLHRDTASPSVGLWVRARLAALGCAIIEWNGNAWWNLGWHFVVTYDRFYRRLMFGSDRFEEVHADRLAALKYGPRNAADGLLHIIRRCAEYDIEQNRAFQNLLANHTTIQENPLRNARAIRSRDLAMCVQRMIYAPAHADDRHPPTARRLELFRSLENEMTDPIPKDSQTPAIESEGLWSLFRDPAQMRADYLSRTEAELQTRLDSHDSLFSQAIAAYTHAVLDAPNKVDPLVSRAQVYFDVSAYSNAKLDLEAALKLNPRDAGILFFRGQIHYALGDFVASASDFQEAMRISRVAYEPCVSAALGDISAISGEFVQAIKHYGRSIELDRLNAEIFLKRANAYLLTYRASKAAADFARAAELDPKSAEIQLGLALAREANGDCVRAIDAAEAAIALDANLPDGHILLSRFLANHLNPKKRDIARAIAHARKAVALSHGTNTDATSLLNRLLSPTDIDNPCESETEGLGDKSRENGTELCNARSGIPNPWEAIMMVSKQAKPSDENGTA